MIRYIFNIVSNVNDDISNFLIRLLMNNKLVLYYIINTLYIGLLGILCIGILGAIVSFFILHPKNAIITLIVLFLLEFIIALYKYMKGE